MRGAEPSITKLLNVWAAIAASDIDEEVEKKEKSRIAKNYTGDAPQAVAPFAF
jgi:hypothetical protein